jgi:hypothetical protein
VVCLLLSKPLLLKITCTREPNVLRLFSTHTRQHRGQARPGELLDSCNHDGTNSSHNRLLLELASVNMQALIQYYPTVDVSCSLARTIPKQAASALDFLHFCWQMLHWSVVSPYVFDRLSNTSAEELQSGNIMASNTILGQDVDPSLLSCDGETPGQTYRHGVPLSELDIGQLPLDKVLHPQARLI